MRYKKYGKNDNVPEKLKNIQIIEDTPAEDAQPLEFTDAEESYEEEMPKKKGHKGLVALIIILVILAAAAAVFFRVGNKFKDVTVEAGTTEIAIDDFLAWKYYKPFSSIVKADPDLNTVGDYPITLSMAGKKETVKLHVVDTSAPEVEFRDIVRGAGYEVKADDFVVSVNDATATTARIASTIPDTTKYGGSKVKVVVTDEKGNETVDTRSLIISWIKEEAQIEVGSEDLAAQLAYDPASEARFFTDDLLKRIDVMNPGDYEIEADVSGEKVKCKVHVADTTAPVLELRNVTVYYESEKPVTAEDFIELASDNSGKVNVQLMTDIPQAGKLTMDVVIRATDPSGNYTEASAQYTRGDDMQPPDIYGLTDMSVEKNSEPDLMTGVSAYDQKDGAVEFEVDTSEVDFTKAGTYFATYTATDEAGNTVRKQRKIVVIHDEEDTKALVAQIAEQCGNDFEAMRAMVQNIVYVTREYGGDDPVWVGFSTWRGNCYVHALCYKALLDYFGYENQLIHCSRDAFGDGEYYSHYWNLVYTTRDGVEGWWHTDGTPGPLHGPTPTLASDAERYETLQNGYTYGARDWDRDEFPATP